MRWTAPIGLGLWLSACALSEPTTEGAVPGLGGVLPDGGNPDALPLDAGGAGGPSQAPPAGDAQTPAPQANGDCDEGLEVIVRDFTEEHPDFERFGGALEGIVAEQLGADHKPVYAPSGATAATTGKAEFDQWYRDVDGVNMRVPTTIAFSEQSPGVFVYDNSSFFPIDGQGFGNGPSGFTIPIIDIPLGGGEAAHNYLFTTEAHTKFTYKGGEQFTFRGDDDLWVFINDTLAVDLGGVHGALEETIDLDSEAARLGIVAGETYPMDIFHAERHTVESNYRIETTIDLSCIENVDIF